MTESMHKFDIKSLKGLFYGGAISFHLQTQERKD